MRKAGFVEDDECWNIAESMIEEIGLIKGKMIGKRSRSAKLRGGLKRMLISKVR